MKNFIVLHKVNGNTCSRWDFGEELDKAINFIHDVMEEVEQYGKHHFVVIDEFTKVNYYNQRFEIV